jgi:hypothetical protein
MNATLRFFATWGLPFVVYLAVQVAAAVRLRGGARWVALVPLLPMTGIVALTLLLREEGLRLWPIALVLISPLAAIFVVVVLWNARRGEPGEPAVRSSQVR